MQPHLFCFGLGYVAEQLAYSLLDKGWRVSGTSRSTEKMDKFRPHGVIVHLFDDDMPLPHPEELRNVTHILHSIPPSEHGDSVFQEHLQDIQMAHDLKWLGYLSTTGVYGDRGGEWVDETATPTAFNDRTQRRIDAEKLWLDTDLPTHIFRLAGIYGQHRNALKDINSGKARRIDMPKQYFSRIHVEDIVQILEASIANPSPKAIYNCADDMPAEQAEVVAYAAQLLNKEPPLLQSIEDANLSEMARSFYQTNRRVKNDRIKDELGITLKYPDYKHGLSALAKML